MATNLLILALYLGVLLWLGWLASRKVKSLTDYFAGGRILGFWVVSFSAQATGSSAWLLLGLCGMGAMVGAQAYWVALGTTTGVALAWFQMGKPFKRIADACGALTIPDFLAYRFPQNHQALRALSAGALAVFVMVYVSAQIDATGTAFESFLGINYFTGAIGGFLVVVLYMFSGGFLAVAWSDVFQGAMMLAGLLALPLVAMYYLAQSQIPLGSTLIALDPKLLSVWGTDGFTALGICKALGLSMIGLGYLGSPQLFVRFIAARDTQTIDQGKWVAITMQFLMNVSAVSIGLLGRAILTEPGDDPMAMLGNGAQEVMLKLVDFVMPEWVGGLYIAAVLAAIMSTIDSLLIVASSAVVRDFYQQTYHPHISGDKLARLSKWVTWGLALLALGISLGVAIWVPGRTVFWFVIFGWSGIAATFCPVMVLALSWKRFNGSGAMAAMVTGFVSVPVFKFAAPALPLLGPYFLRMAELLPSFVLALLAGIIFSLRKPR